MSTDHGGETAGDKTGTAGTAGTADKAGGRTDAGATGAVDAGALFGVTVNCDDAVHELYHYLDGELTEERREEIRVHLDWCGPCSGAADFEGELRKVIANKCKDRVPRTLIDRVAAAIDEESRQHDGGH